MHEMIVATFGGQPDRSGSRLAAGCPPSWPPSGDEQGETPVLVIDKARLLRL